MCYEFRYEKGMELKQIASFIHHAEKLQFHKYITI